MSILICAELGCDVGNAVKAAEFGEWVLTAIPLQAYRAIQVTPLAQKSSTRRIISPPFRAQTARFPISELNAT
jgi:monoamine oxidase